MNVDDLAYDDYDDEMKLNPLLETAKLYWTLILLKVD